MTCSCTKKPYETRAQARVGYHHILAGGGERRSESGRLHAYRCDGGSWHLGRAPLQLVVMHRRKRAAA